MTLQDFPDLDPFTITDTRDALHAYSRVLGAWLKTCQPRRKHWWHSSLRPSLSGLTTGVIRAGVDIELELNLSESLLIGRTSSGERLTEKLHGQSAMDLALGIKEFMVATGFEGNCVPQVADFPTAEFAGFKQEDTLKLGRTVNAVSASLELFRSGIKEETSPIQLWPHHFDLSMLWLPGPKIPGQDPGNEEYADKQMNFGFTFGDEAIRDPYFYVTAYPQPENFPKLQLPPGTTWQSEGFSGAVLPYSVLVNTTNPKTYLVKLWTQLLSAGRTQMFKQST